MTQTMQIILDEFEKLTEPEKAEINKLLTNKLQRLGFLNKKSVDYKRKIKKKEKLRHSPNLNTVLMVEKILKDSGELITVAELKRRLPKKVMHQTLLQILDYLQMSGKILIGTKGILWIFTERKELDRLIGQGTEV